MLRRTLLALTVALAAAAPAGAAQYVAPAGSGALFLFSGHGWGHGVGMSQYGAQGFAENGYPYDQILAHYYPGTTLGQAPLTTIRVLLADRKKRLTVSSPVPFTVQDGNGASHTLPAGKTTFGPGLKLAVDGRPAQPLVPPLTFSPGEGATLALGRAYRGRLLVDVLDGKLRAIDVLPLEQYLYGVVPAEMPSGWLPAALEAQAVAARSYALATRQLAAPYDVDTQGQVYLGVAAEKPTTNAAVDATAGQVVLYGGRVATTYYSSTSGGETESAVDAWGGRAVPYLVAVDDPFDVISPFHDWGPVPLTGKKIAQSLKVRGPIVDASTTPNPAGRVATLDLVSRAAGPTAVPTTTAVSGALARARLGLRSTWFGVGVLSLSAPAATAPVVFGTSVTLSGIVRGVGDVVVQQRSTQMPWTPLAAVAPDPAGAVELVETPTVTTDYRLATPDAAAAFVRVRVKPRVTLAAPQSATQVSGTEQPVLPGAKVQVQQPNPAGAPAWTTIATGAVDANGAFTVPVSLAPGGSYRVVVSPGHGYSPEVVAVTVGA